MTRIGTRRLLLLRSASGVAAFCTGFALLSAAGQARAAALATQAASGYITHPASDGDHCGACQFFSAPSSCAAVAGTISASGWCNYFTAKS